MPIGRLYSTYHLLREPETNTTYIWPVGWLYQAHLLREPGNNYWYVSSLPQPPQDRFPSQGRGLWRGEARKQQREGPFWDGWRKSWGFSLYLETPENTNILDLFSWLCVTFYHGKVNHYENHRFGNMFANHFQQIYDMRPEKCWFPKGISSFLGSSFRFKVSFLGV